MSQSFCFSLTLVLMLQVSVTAGVNDQQSIIDNIEHPFRGNVSCSSVCPPEKSRDKDIVFCRDNCQDYWNRMISAIFADPSGLVNRTTDCTQHNFTHVPSNNVIPCSNFRDFSNSTDNEKNFWSKNCINYFVCIIGMSMAVLSGRNISSSTTSTSPPPNPVSFTDQPNQSSLTPWFILLIAFAVLCVAFCGCLTALIVYLRRRRRKHPQGDGRVDEINLQTNLLGNQPAPGNPTDDDRPTSGRNAEADAESMSTGPPIQEVGDPSHSNEASWTTPKEIDSNCFSLRSDPYTERNTETQQNPVD